MGVKSEQPEGRRSIEEAEERKVRRYVELGAGVSRPGVLSLAA